MSDGRGWVQVARGATLCSTSFAFAVGAHLLGGGHLPSPQDTGGLLVVAALAALTLAASAHAARLRARWTVPFLAALHLTLHHGLARVPVPGADAAAAGHHGSTLPALPVVLGGPADDGTMVAAHAAAVLFTAALLTAAERAARSAAALWTALGAALLGVFRPVVVPWLRTAPVPARVVPTGLVAVGALPRRGPPTPPVALA